LESWIFWGRTIHNLPCLLIALLELKFSRINKSYLNLRQKVSCWWIGLLVVNKVYVLLLKLVLAARAILVIDLCWPQPQTGRTANQLQDVIKFNKFIFFLIQ
jgi:hypothetical protein